MPGPGIDVSKILERPPSVNVAAVAADPVDGIEIQFQTYAGVTYQIEYSSDFVTWSLLPTIYQGDGTIKSASIHSDHPKLFFRMREKFYESSEPYKLQAYAAFDGTYVLLEWTKFTSTPQSATAHWKISRDNQQVTTVPISAVSYKDLGVSPGPHTYTVGFYN